ncbi:Cysteine-rich protein 2-binding protein [Cichlidogyrus casuarinus]|uniref:Cysteine-rich protein 2-binding protein n=1 Tax=Cichlidogyrus casuarinus TaxID=1844966 RepID=A0ABD2QDT5_9PLAT
MKIVDVLREQEKAKEKRTKNLQWAEEVGKQIGIKQKWEAQKLEQDKIEGEELRRNYILAQLEEQKRAEIRKFDGKLLKQSLCEQCDERRRLQCLEQQQEAERERKCKQFALDKSQVLQRRLETQQAIDTEKEKLRNDTLCKLEAKLLEAKQAELDRTEIVSKEKRIQEDLRLENKMKERQETLRDIECFRQLKIEEARKMKESEHMATLEERAQIEKNYLLDVTERNLKARKRFEYNVHVCRENQALRVSKNE